MSEPGLLDQLRYKTAESVTAQTAPPIFILGIAARSGTNYLHDLIRMHPDCDAGSAFLEEDNLVANAHLLSKYVDEIARWWKYHWSAEELQSEKEVLVQQLGQSLERFLSAQLEKRKQSAGMNGSNGHPLRLVTKTPTVKNLPLFFRLFPERQLVVLVRDGRAVVESAVKTFDRPYGHAAQEWGSAARIIQDCRGNHPQNGFLLVRYEDLYGNVEKELRRIFDYLNLDPETYDYAAAANLPVRGSSTLRDQASSQNTPWVARGIHWKPVEKPANFNPVERWASWGRVKHERFNWLAGEYLEQFGYARKNFSGYRLPWVLWNVLLDTLHVDGAVWLCRRAHRKWKEIRSVEDFLAFFQTIKRTVIEALWEGSEFGK